MSQGEGELKHSPSVFEIVTWSTRALLPILIKMVLKDLDFIKILTTQELC